MSRTIACVVARTVSTRLPLKILRTVTGELTMLDFIIQRLKRSKKVDDIYICTSKEAVDEIIEDIAVKNGVKIYRGEADNVLERLITVAEKEGADNIIRVTGDNVFNDVEYLDKLIEVHCANSLDYSRIIGLPFGVTPEVLSYKGLRKCNSEIDPMLSEYLTVFMYNPALYKCGAVNIRKTHKDLTSYTLTVDNPEDLIRTRLILEAFGEDKLKITLSDIITIIEQKQIPHALVNTTGLVKLPNNVKVAFGDFMKDLESRCSRSFQFSI